MNETSKSKEAERRLDQSAGSIAAVEFLKKVHCHYDNDEDIYTLRYFDFIAGFNENQSRITQLETEKAQAEGRVKKLESALNRVLTACDTANLSSHNQMREAIEDSINIATEALNK